MKIKSIIAGLFVTAMVATSCGKQIELVDPQGLPPGEAVANDANIKKTLQGGYDAISSGNLFGGNTILFADLLASNGELFWVGTFNTYREIWGKNILTTNPLVSGTWSSGYSAINIANNVLANVSKVADADRNRVQGEALFIRAAVEFDLVRYFAKDYTDGNPSTNLGIPLMTAPVNSVPEITKPARATVQAVYAAIVADLTQAETLLPTTNSVYATKSAAAAILSRVYLQMANYQGARDAADRAITNATGKSLLPNFMDNFNQAANTAEDLFAIQVSDQDGVNDLQLFYSVDIFGARDGDIEVEASHFALYQSGDARSTVTTNPTTAQFNTAFYTKYGALRTNKWRDLYKNVKVIRLAEMYLTRAEANARLNTSVGATPMADINRIRSRAKLVEFTTAPTVDQIYLERRRELAFEGFGIHDAKRFKRTIDGEPWNANSLVLPIPFRELNANSNLVQNPGYQ